MLNKKATTQKIEPKRSSVMKIEQIDLKDTGCFSSLFLDYINQRPELASFYKYYPYPENFADAIAEKEFSAEKRKVLHRSLMDQYNHSCSFMKVKENIDLVLNENTYTITTGHQLNIFTGPLYFIYKIITVINTCKELKERYPEKEFVPIYWMASEDHDFEEINHFYAFGKKYEWSREGKKGAVGRMSPKELIGELRDIGFIPDKFKEAYRQNKTLSEATREIVNSLFGEEGLVIIDADSPALKSLFKDIIKKELEERRCCEIVNNTSQELTELGYKIQIAPREINIFYLDNDIRERIVWDDGQFKVLNTQIILSKEAILKLVESNPEKFSPNVVLRPIYQETILPNVAYIGGPAEVIYWLQLKETFDYYQTPFPILLPRNFALVINNQLNRKFRKLKLPVQKLFLDDNSLKNFYLEKNTENSFHLNGEINKLQEIFSEIQEKAVRIDKTLKDFVGAEMHRAKTQFEGIEKKLKKAEERNQEVGIIQLQTIKAKLFPDGQLQERHDNFLNFYLDNPDFIKIILKSLSPFKFTFNILTEDEESRD